MRILIVSQYFWPENFRINDLTAELVRRGHEVTVLTGHPNYPGGSIFPEFAANPKGFNTYEGAEVIRVPLVPRGNRALLLALNYLSFMFTASALGAWKLRGRTFDATFVFQGSPVTVGIPAIVIKWLKRTPIALWVLDLWPQSLSAVGAVKSPFILGLVDRLVTFIYANCDMVLGQSRAFVPELQRHMRDPDRIGYLPSWSDNELTETSAEPAPEIPLRPDLFNIVFAGNVGEAQDFPAVVDAAEALRDEPVRWIIVGDGRKSAWLAEEVARRNLSEKVLTPGRYDLPRMPSFFSHADALLVCLRNEEIFAMTIPGKVQTYLSAGIPILAMLNGEGADVVEKSGAGFAIPAGDGLGLANAVRRMRALSAAERSAMGKRGPETIKNQFDRQTIMSQIETMLADLAARAAAGQAKRR